MPLSLYPWSWHSPSFAPSHRSRSLLCRDQQLSELRQRELTTAEKLDQLVTSNRQLQESVRAGEGVAAALRARINQVEGRTEHDFHALEDELNDSRSAAALSQSLAVAQQRSETRASRTERESRERREREHEKVMRAYMAEVGDQRREIEGLRSQLGAAHATTLLSSTRRMMDDGSLHSSVFAS
jgi:chromosome segregation ATPase